MEINIPLLLYCNIVANKTKEEFCLIFSLSRKMKRVWSLVTDMDFALMVIMKQREQGFHFQIKMDNEGQFLTCLFGYSVPAQFNWDQVIAQKATQNTLSSFSVTSAHLVILMFVKNCHKGVHLTEKNNLYVIAQLQDQTLKGWEKDSLKSKTLFSLNCLNWSITVM